LGGRQKKRAEKILAAKAELEAETKAAAAAKTKAQAEAEEFRADAYLVRRLVVSISQFIEEARSDPDHLLRRSASCRDGFEGLLVLQKSYSNQRGHRNRR
jgi:hypothetical protein